MAADKSKLQNSINALLNKGFTQPGQPNPSTVTEVAKGGSDYNPNGLPLTKQQGTYQDFLRQQADARFSQVRRNNSPISAIGTGMSLPGGFVGMPANSYYDYNWGMDQYRSALDEATKDVRDTLGTTVNANALALAKAQQSAAMNKRMRRASGLTTGENYGAMNTEDVQDALAVAQAANSTNQSNIDTVMSALRSLYAKEADLPDNVLNMFGAYNTNWNNYLAYRDYGLSAAYQNYLAQLATNASNESLAKLNSSSGLSIPEYLAGEDFANLDPKLQKLTLMTLGISADDADAYFDSIKAEEKTAAKQAKKDEKATAKQARKDEKAAKTKEQWNAFLRNNEDYLRAYYELQANPYKVFNY